ncbi:hypothetical protein BDW02DRAFT_642162 [Decorospora gaudefroyi]|uniref:Stress-response A/B barrel domain-containing protein n=1 Tax=Decorospora gaudefroyi TaxID=184978 RepID=A0A6A5K0M9_9PLEO|nr:hypothetical protein BDW02DRAFT_642162 [Decorospora gaudefroyi]
MPIIHIVLFEWKPTASHYQIQKICTQMLALKENCIHATTQKPYIKSFTGGKNNSPEGHAGNLSHGFVVEFESVADRDYYVHEDAAHLAFVKDAGELIEGIKVLDYEVGKM